MHVGQFTAELRHDPCHLCWSLSCDYLTIGVDVWQVTWRELLHLIEISLASNHNLLLEICLWDVLTPIAKIDPVYLPMVVIYHLNQSVLCLFKLFLKQLKPRAVLLNFPLKLSGFRVPFSILKDLLTVLVKVLHLCLYILLDYRVFSSFF